MMVIANSNGGVFHFLHNLSSHRGPIPYSSLCAADPQSTGGCGLRCPEPSVVRKTKNMMNRKDIRAGVTS